MASATSRAPGSFALLVALATVTLALTGAHGQQSGKTTADGVYSAAQAERGAEAYSRYCARCHGGDLDGVGAAPMLYSSRFLDRYREDSLRTLYDYVATAMPLDGTPGPGKLTQAQYLDIVAFLLQSSELPAGAAELRGVDLDTTLLVGPDGPQPLPASATVRVVGCLAQASGTWIVRNASAPARVRQADATDAQELARAAQTPSGTSTFRLPNLTDDHTAAQLTALGSRKVQVKGVLNGEGANARITVLSFEPLTQTCQ
jgi:S-disulfanyl-L-cysteine oxidoreductase SoxD